MEVSRYMCQAVTRRRPVNSIVLARLAVDCHVPGVTSRKCRAAIEAAKAR